MRRAFLIAALVFLASTACRAADAPAAVNDLQSTEAFIGSWLVLGMFDNAPIEGAGEGSVTRAGFDTDYLTALGGEAKAKLFPDTVVKTGSGDIGPAKLVTADPSGLISIDPLFKGTDYKFAYAYCEVRSDREQTVYGHSGSNDGIKIWVNGEEVLSFFTESRNADRDQNHFTARLHPGLNPVLVKIDNKGEDWNFLVELYTEEYEKSRFPSRVERLAVVPDRRSIDAAAGKVGFHVEFQPHSLAFSPATTVSLETLDGRTLGKAAPKVGQHLEMEVPSDAGTVLVLKTAMADFNGKALAGSARVLRGGVADIKADLFARIARLASGEPKGMSRDAWTRHVALAKYYQMLLGLDGSKDPMTVEVLRNRNAAPTEVVPLLTELVTAMEAGRDVYAGMTGAMRAAYISTADGSAQPYVYYVPDGYDAARAWPLVIQLHGSGGSSGDTESLKWSKPAFYVNADGRGMYNGYINLAEDDVLEVIADLRKYYNIDPARICLKGSSMGGMGTWAMTSRYPDLFAAGASYCGMPTLSRIENLANVPLWTLHDQIDWVVAIDRDRWGIRLLQDWGYPAKTNESNGFGHNAAGGAAAAGLQVTDWLLTNVRPDAPARIVYTTETPLRGRAYWVTIKEFADPSMPATVRATAGKDNRLELELDNVETLEVNAPATLFDASRPVDVAFDSSASRIIAPVGEKFFVHRKAGGWETLKSDPTVAGAVRLYTIGGLSNLYSGEPMLIVQGTSGTEGVVGAMARLAGDMKGCTNAGAPMDFATIPAKLDTEVTDEDMRTRNLILIGGPSQNAVTRRMADKLVAVEKDGKVVVDGKLSYGLAGRGYMLYHYNPLAPDRLVFVIASGEESFYNFRGGLIGSALAARMPLDFVLADVKPLKLVRVISWNKEWKPAGRFADGPKLANAFGDTSEFWKEMGASILGLAKADYALCPIPQRNRGFAIPFDVSAATWADAQIIWGWQPIVAADVTGQELLDIVKAAKATSDIQLLPVPDEGSVDQKKVYRLSMPEDVCSALARARHKNLDAVRFVTYKAFDDVKKRLCAQ